MPESAPAYMPRREAVTGAAGPPPLRACKALSNNRKTHTQTHNRRGRPQRRIRPAATDAGKGHGTRPQHSESEQGHHRPSNLPNRMRKDAARWGATPTKSRQGATFDERTAGEQPGSP